MDGIQYQYDDAGRLTKIVDYDAAELAYAYDAAIWAVHGSLRN